MTETKEDYFKIGKDMYVNGEQFRKFVLESREVKHITKDEYNALPEPAPEE